MIKKIIYTIGFLMFLSAPLGEFIYLNTTMAGTDQAKDSEKSCPYDHYLKCKLDVFDGLEWGDTFGKSDTSKIGKGLYKLIYSKTQIRPDDEAVQATADQYGMSVEKMRLIVGGDLSPILARSPLMKIEEANQLYNQMMDTYVDKKNSSELNAAIKAKVEPNELFADGDLDNSGFDLLNDLKNIEIILFKKADPVTIGGNRPQDKSEDNAGQPAEQPKDNKPVDLNGGIISSGGASGGSAKSESEKSGIAKTKNPFEEFSAAENKAPTLNGFNPNQCFSEAKTETALNKFQDDLKNNKKLKSNFVPPVKNQAGQNKINQQSNAAVEQANTSNLPAGTPAPSDQVTLQSIADKLLPAVADDWNPVITCGDIFCMTLEFIKAPVVPAFNKTDNCIQCHVQYINDSLQKTISHSLIPGKAPGNFGEGALCKSATSAALGAVSLNINVTLVPIKTPVKNEMADLSLDMGLSKAGKDYGKKIVQEWELMFCKQNPSACADKKAREAKDKADKTPMLDQTEKEILVAINTAADGASQDLIWNGARIAAEAKQALVDSDNLMVAVSEEATGQAKTYLALELEMKKMNDFFTAFRKILMTLYEDVPGMNSTKSCTKLTDKQYCT